MLLLISFYARCRRLACAAALAAGLLGCVAPLPQGAQQAADANGPLKQTPVATEAATPASPPRVQNAVAPILVYADQIRPLQGPELAQEIARFTDLSTPEDQLKLSIALVQTRQLYDLVRAQELLQRVLANTGGQARLLHPLARILAARFAEQRRVEDQLDRQGSQLRDAQRRLEQTNDKLEALKEIERSLTSRPGAAPPAQPLSRNSRSRTKTP